MPTSAIVGAITAIRLASQLWVASTDTFGGLSGQDSIIRALLTPVDCNCGLLLFFALLHYFECLEKANFLKLSRWDLLHASQYLQESSFLEFPIRTNWKQIEQPIRIARTKWRKSHNQAFSELFFRPNTSLFFVPYMRHRVPLHVSQNPPMEPPQHGFELSQDIVENAAAISIARFFILLTWSFVIFILHSCLLWFYIDKWYLYMLVIFPTFGRLLITWFQSSSIMTYSCFYKGVFTWAVEIGDESFQSWNWNEEKQSFFSRLVWIELGCHYPAKAFFYVIDLLWPSIITRFSPGLERGSSMFATFRSPPGVEFTHGGELELTVWEKGFATEYPVSKINFMKVPEIFPIFMKNPLVPSTLEKRIFGLSAVAPVIFGIFDSIIIGCSESMLVLKVLYTLEQLAVSVLRYYDFSEISINTKLDSRVFPTDEDYAAENTA